jgi:two-component system LytT family response regulator
VLLDVKDIDWIASEGNYVKLHTTNKTSLLRETMKAMEQKLDPSSFLRVRRSAIVRIERIQELHPLFNGEFEIVLKDGTKITSSRRYRKNLESLLRY